MIVCRGHFDNPGQFPYAQILNLNLQMFFPKSECKYMSQGLGCIQTSFFGGVL